MTTDKTAPASRIHRGAAALPLLALAAVVSAQDPATHHLYTFAGDQPADRFGAALGAAGDVNGDGLADVIAGAPHADGAGSSTGLARVLSGADGAELFTFSGSAAGDWFGSAVDGAGDVDGDGFADLIVGAPLGTPSSGCAHVFSGATGAPLMTWSGDAPGDRFGAAVSGVGDVDGDGFTDVAVGAPYGGAAGWSSGYVRAYSGVDGRLLQSWLGSTGDFFGTSLSPAGDIDGDGRADVLIGAPLTDAGAFNAGSAYVHSGASGALLHAFHGAQIGDQLGYWVGGAGDVDGDGLTDLVLGVPGADMVGIDSGAAEVRSGAGGGLLFLVSGAADSDTLGAVGNAGDVDGDGRSDLLVGAASSDAGGTEAGTVRIVSGATGLDLSAFHGAATFDWFGAVLAGVGDANGDGRGDFAVGAPGHDDDVTKKGYVQVLSGTALALASDLHALSVTTGGTQTLSLNAPAPLAGLSYYLLGSAAGTTPGIPLPGGVLPLAFDPAYFPWTLQNPFTGMLGPGGEGTVTLGLPSASNPGLSGLVLHHAYLVLDGTGSVAFISNATPLSLQ